MSPARNEILRRFAPQNDIVGVGGFRRPAKLPLRLRLRSATSPTSSGGKFARTLPPIFIGEVAKSLILTEGSLNT